MKSELNLYGECCKAINASRVRGNTTILTRRSFKVRRLHNNFLTRFRGRDMHRTSILLECDGGNVWFHTVGQTFWRIFPRMNLNDLSKQWATVFMTHDASAWLWTTHSWQLGPHKDTFVCSFSSTGYVEIWSKFLIVMIRIGLRRHLEVPGWALWKLPNSDLSDLVLRLFLQKCSCWRASKTLWRLPSGVTNSGL